MRKRYRTYKQTKQKQFDGLAISELVYMVDEGPVSLKAGKRFGPEGKF